MGRYSTLYRLPANLYVIGSPVLVSAGALLKDEQIGRVLAQIKFKSLSSREIRAVKVSIQTYDISGDELEGVDEYQFLDLSAVRGDSFGDRRAIPMPNPVARSFTLCVKSVTFADGTSWICDNPAPWIALPRLITLEDALGSKELAAQYVRETSDRSAYAPYELEDVWYCSCGAVNKAGETFCDSCGSEKSMIFNCMNEDMLERNYSRWAAQHELDSSAEQQHTRKKKSTLLKVLLIILPILLVIAAAFIAVTQYLLPMVAYKRADEKLSLHDYSGAIEGFTALGNYKDAPDKVITAKYDAAVSLMDDGEYDKARTEFILLGGYSDSDEMVSRCDYLQAEKLLSSKDYDAARDAFLALGSYSDAAERADEALYNKAQALLDAGQSETAAEIFESLGSYSDSADKAVGIRQDAVDRVNRLIRQNRFDEAWTAYAELVDYSPAPLTAEDFVVPDGDMREFLDETTTGSMNFGAYKYTGNGYDSRKDVTVTNREIRLGACRLEVLMAYGEPDEEGSFRTDVGFYIHLPEAEQDKMAEECDHYVRYSLDNYKIYFYFDNTDTLTWIIFTNGDYQCSGG